MTKDELKNIDNAIDKNADQIDKQIRDLEVFLLHEYMEEQANKKTPEIVPK